MRAIVKCFPNRCDLPDMRKVKAFDLVEVKGGLLYMRLFTD